MNADITGSAIAVPGVAGTLAAPVLTQRLAMRARQQELDAQHASAVSTRGLLGFGNEDSNASLIAAVPGRHAESELVLATRVITWRASRAHDSACRSLLAGTRHGGRSPTLQDVFRPRLTGDRRCQSRACVPAIGAAGMAMRPATTQAPHTPGSRGFRTVWALSLG